MDSESTPDEEFFRLFIESTDGERFECEIPRDLGLSQLAADFFEERGWPTRDGQGRGQRAVVELVDPDNPERTKRLRGEHNANDAGLYDGAIVRVFPESIAGAVDTRERLRALIADHQEMETLVGWNSHIQFEANKDFAPTLYTVTFDYPSFKALGMPGQPPILTQEHRAEIELGAEYPRHAPFVRWQTPIFHPNIRTSDGAVCLGVLRERYLPGLGLARLVTMLAEMVQFRNFDSWNSLNQEAGEWAANTENWKYIQEIGGSPFQGPIQALFEQHIKEQGEGKERSRIVFRRVIPAEASV